MSIHPGYNIRMGRYEGYKVVNTRMYDLKLVIQ